MCACVWGMTDVGVPDDASQRRGTLGRCTTRRHPRRCALELRQSRTSQAHVYTHARASGAVSDMAVRYKRGHDKRPPGGGKRPPQNRDMAVIPVLLAGAASRAWQHVNWIAHARAHANAYGLCNALLGGRTLDTSLPCNGCCSCAERQTREVRCNEQLKTGPYVAQSRSLANHCLQPIYRA